MASNFTFENDINMALRLDAPITRGPMMRWQRKQNESLSHTNTSLNCSNLNMTNNCSMNMSSTNAKTPMKSSSLGNMSVGANKTPGQRKGTPSRASKTPGKKTPGRGNKTPGGADRFIPNRGTTQFDVGHYRMMSDQTPADDELMSPSKRDFQKNMNDNLNGTEMAASKIISYNSKAPQVPEGYQNNLKVLYSCSKTPGSCKKTTRHIPQVPERILDAPDILDDYYLNLLDWSANNHLAVALGPHIYLWSAASGEITQLLEMPNSEDYVSSVSWIKEGNYLAIGTSNNEVQLWDAENTKRIRSMTGHAARVGALSWNSYILSSGSRSGYIHHHDVRVPDHHVATLGGHAQEVCGLKWSPDGKYLASGGNDNVLNVWSNSYNTVDNSPLHVFTQHQAAVKAVAWCPWQPSILASGGGTADRHIRFWNCNTGQCIKSLDTKSQVCSLLWSNEYKEVISSHGYANNELIIWKYPSMIKVAELTGHTSRVLHMSMSPDGTSVVSAAADETLRIWKCFDVDKTKKKAATTTIGKSGSSILRQGIR